MPGFQTVSYPIENSVSRRGEGVQTATLGLNRTVIREDLARNNASLNIKCVASIYTAYYKTVELKATLRIRKKRRKENLRKKHQQKKDIINGTNHSRFTSLDASLTLCFILQVTPFNSCLSALLMLML